MKHSSRRLRRVLSAATILAASLAVPAVASANQTVGIPYLNCSVTAYTPTFSSGPTVNGKSGVSCGGSQAGYAKTSDTQLMDLVTGGWQQVSATGWHSWFYGNPLSVGLSYGPCVAGRWYAVVAQGRVDGGGYDSSNTASSENSGAQCP